jgi:hypothetical protein
MSKLCPQNTILTHFVPLIVFEILLIICGFALENDSKNTWKASCVSKECRQTIIVGCPELWRECAVSFSPPIRSMVN